MGRISFGFFGYRFKTDNNWLTYKTAYGKSVRVLKQDITSVSVAEGKRGRGKLRINGQGTTLAEIELPRPWANKAQEFILKEIGKLS